MVIQHNISALNSHRNLGLNNGAIGKNLEKLSSGYRINRAGDDAAGLAISEKMRGQIRGLAMAEQNASNGISLIQTGEGALQETHAILQRMRELAVQASNGTYKNEVDRENLNKEFEAVKSEVDRISESTHYNGIQLLDGSIGKNDGTEVQSLATGKGLTLAASQTVTGGTMKSGEVYSGTVDYKMTEQEDGTFNLKVTLADVDGKTRTAEFTGITAGTSSMTMSMGDATVTFTAAATDSKIEFADNNGVKMTITMSAEANKTDYKSHAASNMAFTYKAADATSLDTGDNKDNKSFSQAINTNAYQVNGKAELIFQIGANGTADQRVGLSVGKMDSKTLGFNGGKWLKDASIADQDLANEAINIIDNALNQVSGTRADLGALQNRLEHTLNNLGVTKENLTAAESSIRDVDMAKEMMEFTKNNILVQASQSMLAQANQVPQGVLQLLR